MENRIRIAPISPLYNLPGKNNQDKNNRRKNKKPETSQKEDQAFVVELRKKVSTQ